MIIGRNFTGFYTAHWCACSVVGCKQAGSGGENAVRAVENRIHCIWTKEWSLPSLIGSLCLDAGDLVRLAEGILDIGLPSVCYPPYQSLFSRTEVSVDQDFIAFSLFLPKNCTVLIFSVFVWSFTLFLLFQLLFSLTTQLSCMLRTCWFS